MLDVGAAAGVLFDEILTAPVRQRLLEVFDVDAGGAERTIPLLAALHDVGKATPDFQILFDEGKQVVEAAGLAFPSARGAFRHHGESTANILFGVFSKECNWDHDAATNAAVALGGHHGAFPSAVRNRQWGGGLSRSQIRTWEETQSDLIRLVVSAIGLERADLSSCQANELAWINFAGFVSVADWLGSAVSQAAQGSGESHSEYYSNALDAAREMLRQVGWCKPSRPDGEYSYHALFGWAPSARPRPLQMAVAELLRSHPAARLIVIEAPMGEGKTEAALYAARQSIESFTPGGLFFALPTMATSNAMFARVTAWLSNAFAGMPAESHLLHGAAWRNEQYQELRDLTSLLSDEVFDDDARATGVGGVTAHEWFVKSKRGLLAPFGTGTIDQALVAVLRCRHHFVRLHALGSKTIILDEVHAYDTYMSALLDRLISFLVSLGCRVILLSATLPRNRLLELVVHAAGPRHEAAPLPPYPRITLADPDGSVFAAGFEASPFRPTSASPPQENKTIGVEHVAGGAAAVVETLLERIKDGGCAALVCNTVRVAQECHSLAERLIAENPRLHGTDLHLFHARYPAEERDQIERRIVAAFAAPGADGISPNRPGRSLVIATQVIEQSLDLDFDIMGTELAPIDLILQRSGRLWRHERATRPVNSPIVLLARPSDSTDGTPDFGASAYVYEPAVLFRTALALQHCEAIRVPADVEALIEFVYDGTDKRDAMPKEWGACYAVTREREQAALDKQKGAAQAVLVPAPDEIDDCEFLRNANIFRSDELDDPTVHEHFRAVTRLGDPSVECICLHRVSGNLAFDEQGNDPVDTGTMPSADTLLRLLNRCVRISSRAVAPHLLPAHQVPGAWSRCGSLRHCALLAFENRSFQVGRRVVEWHPTRGIIIHKEEPSIP